MNEVGCHNCIGACCTRYMELPLSNDEADVLRSAGTALVMLLDPTRDLQTAMPSESPFEKQLQHISRQLPSGIGLFQLLSNCGFLEPTQDGMAKCSLFGEQKRPTVCSTFQESSATCRRVRLTRGIWDY